MTATSGASAASSADVNARPSSGSTPSTAKYSPATVSPPMRSGAPLPYMMKSAVAPRRRSSRTIGSSPSSRGNRESTCRGARRPAARHCPTTRPGDRTPDTAAAAAPPHSAIQTSSSWRRCRAPARAWRQASWSDSSTARATRTEDRSIMRASRARRVPANSGLISREPVTNPSLAANQVSACERPLAKPIRRQPFSTAHPV